MAVFGGRSESYLKSTHPDLVRVHRRAILNFDYSIIQSARTKEEQEADFLKGTTRAHWLESPHDYALSFATDCAPFPIDWVNRDAFHKLADVILAAARVENVPITWGGTFHSLKDLPHFELTNWRNMRHESALIA